ncbi:MAG: SMP-30/gluconolactonase/LRE family protein [Armatimonadota bacterium]
MPISPDDPAVAPQSINGLDTILAENAVVEKLSGGFIFTEGPVYEAATDTVVFSDIPADTLYRYSVLTRTVEKIRQPSGQANGNTRDHSGRLITCEHENRRVSRTESDGMVVTLAYAFGNRRLNSPNDIVVKSDGALYFTDPPYGLPEQTVGKEQEHNGVYRISGDGTLTLLVDDFVRPNGLAFSPDEKTLYIDDSHEQHIRAFDVAPDGTLGSGRLFATLKDLSKKGNADGMKVDNNGTVFCTGAGGVWVFAADGTHRGNIETPEVPANVCFGDSDGQTLYITAHTSLYRIRLKTAGPIPGRKSQ